MTPKLKNILTTIAKNAIGSQDPAHDFEHASRVLTNALSLAKLEQADLDIIIPAALFHDLITYPKNDPRSPNAQTESAQAAAKILQEIADYPQSKIPAVYQSIELCSFSKGILPDTLEAKILQDADGLEATGAIAIMRTYASTGLMNRPFYHPTDPFAKHRPTNSKAYALDLFYDRLLKVEERMHTQSARKIAARRTKFLHQFLAELQHEINGE